MKLKGKSVLSMNDLSRQEIEKILSKAIELKKKQKKRIFPKLCKDKTLAMIFEKPSTRTRVSFEVGMFQLGGYGFYLEEHQLQRVRGESIADTARVLSRYCDGIMARVYSHKTLETLRDNASVPVINGLSDLEHPCQILGDFLTIKEFKKKLKGINLAFLGDVDNVSNSLMLGSSILGINFTAFTPSEFFVEKEIKENALKHAKKSFAKIEIKNNLDETIKEMDFLYTDVWISMGQNLSKGRAKRLLTSFQINSKLLEKSKPAVKVMHCLPAHRGEEITSEVIDGKHSIVFQQAENRLHAQKALLSLIL